MTLGIGIITYKRAKALIRTASAILGQTKHPYYLVVAEDGGGDDTVDHCRVGNVTVVTGQNRGVCWNKNRALYTLLTRTTAEQIILLEDDCYPTKIGWEQEWIEAAAKFHHVNYANPGWPEKWCRGGSGTATDPWLSWEISGAATITTRAALEEVGYLHTGFRGYGYGHIEWTERFCKARYINRELVPCLRGALVMEEAVTFRNMDDVRRNYALGRDLRNQPFGYCPPWQAVEERHMLEGEIAQALSFVPLQLRGAPLHSRRKFDVLVSPDDGIDVTGVTQFHVSVRNPIAIPCGPLPRAHNAGQLATATTGAMTVARTAAEAHNEGVKCALAGDSRSAVSHLREAVRLARPDRVDPRTLKALWGAGISSGDWKTGIAAAILAAARDPGDTAFVRRAVLSLDRCPRAELLAESCFPTVSLPSVLPSLSIVLISADDGRFASANEEYERSFAGWPHERIRINDARSMYDGYARGYAQASGEIVVFSHDDIRFAIPDFAARLANAMADSDMVGVAGTTHVSGPTLLWAGHPYLFGTITHKADSEPDYEFGVLSLAGPRISGAQGLDGVFLAARRTLVERIGFDTERFTGFHFYDLDFSYRAHLAGARVTIASDLALIHKSRGSFDVRWTEAQQVFAGKFTFAYAPPGKERDWYVVRRPDGDAVAEMYAKLFAAWALTLV